VVYKLSLSLPFTCLRHGLTILKHERKTFQIIQHTTQRVQLFRMISYPDHRDEPPSADNTTIDVIEWLQEHSGSLGYDTYKVGGSD
jgi:hypothetical protein